MTMPTQEAQRSRETAMQAERHFFVQRLEALADIWRDEARRLRACGDFELACPYESCAVDLGHLIDERTK